jgi:glycosyltransferase involved in cell wall biosynthesis
MEASQLLNTDGVAKLFAPSGRFYPGSKTELPTFIFIGTWEGRKRGKFVAECFTRFIAPLYPEARLFMACDYVPLSSFLIALDNPSEEILAKVLRESWALLSASTYEGFGIPYLEALMSGTAVITTKNSGATYVLEGGKYGCIVEDDDFSNQIIELIRKPSLREAYENNGLKRASDFAEAKVITEHLQQYQTAIGRFQARTSARSLPLQPSTKARRQIQK